MGSEKDPSVDRLNEFWEHKWTSYTCLFTFKKEMQMKWKCLIFRVAENSARAHAATQIVFKYIATVPAEWLSVLSAGQAKTKDHQAILILLSDLAVPVF